MKHTPIRVALAVLETCIALGAIGGSIALLSGIFDQWLPRAWLQGTPFETYTIPGLILLLVIGGGMLLAAATVSIHHEGSVLFSAAMGLIMVGFELVEVMIIDRYAQAVVPSTIVQQVLFSGLGLIIFGLAAFVWVTEYGSQHHLFRRGRHA